MKKILHHSRFAPKPFGHGGERRTTQIKEYYNSRGFELESLIITPQKHFSISHFVKSFKILHKVYGLKKWKSLRRFMKWWLYMYRILPCLENYFKQETEIFIWESTLEVNYYLPYVAKKYGKIVYAYPHNIETLVTEQHSNISGLDSPNGFTDEIKALGNCDKVFTISVFDNQLLCLFGVNTEYWAYEAPVDVQQFLNDIKLKRQIIRRNEIKRFLMLGTAYNPPTRMGMEMLIEILNKSEIKNVRFIVAGFGTEILKEKSHNSVVEIKGALTDKELENEMLRCDALLVYQKPTTGALTRVSEFLTAGIPVVLNIESAHSFFDKEDLYIYESKGELMQIIDRLS